jgi:hypothetical protein
MDAELAVSLPIITSLTDVSIGGSLNSVGATPTVVTGAFDVAGASFIGGTGTVVTGLSVTQPWATPLPLTLTLSSFGPMVSGVLHSVVAPSPVGGFPVTSAAGLIPAAFIPASGTIAAIPVVVVELGRARPGNISFVADGSIIISGPLGYPEGNFPPSDGVGWDNVSFSYLAV